jgi:hypothetical protein
MKAWGGSWWPRGPRRLISTTKGVAGSNPIRVTDICAYGGTRAGLAVGRLPSKQSYKLLKIFILPNVIRFVQRTYSVTLKKNKNTEGSWLLLRNMEE